MKKILIIEDNEICIMLVQKKLKQVFPRAEIVVAIDGIKGQAQLRNYFDIIIVDIFLPHIDGYTLIKEYRQNGGRSFVIAHTAQAEKNENGLFDFVCQKPFSEWKKLFQEIGF